MQAILASMDVNFAELCYLAASGSLTGIPDVARRRHAFNLVLTSPEYPNKSKRDDPIVIDDQLYALDNVVLLHAGTGKSDSGEFTTAGGGRLMNLIATAPTLPEARDLAYRAQEFVQYPGKKFRLISVA